MNTRLSVSLACAALLCGCATQPSQEQTGMVVGGLLGGIIGSQVGHGQGRTTATIIGTLAGAAIGGSVGRSMDQTDRMKTSHALETIRTGVPSTWRNPDSGNQYTVTPTRTIESAGQPCREYTIDAHIGGKPDKVYGTACRQVDGSWRVGG